MNKIEGVLVSKTTKESKKIIIENPDFSIFWFLIEQERTYWAER